jgi:hypothetical protein
VGQFHSLQQWVTQGGTERLQQLLQATGIKPTAYKQAADHVQRTAFPDFRPRVWWWKGEARGLLCAWNLAATAPGLPLAWVVRQTQQQQQGLPCLLVPLNMPGCEGRLQQALQLAQKDWRAAGHGSWEVFWSDAADPLAEAWAARGMLFNLRALPAGLLNAAAAPAAARDSTDADSAAAAVAVGAAAANAAASSASVPLLLELPAVASVPAQQQELLLQQLQQPPPTPALHAPLQQLLSSQQQQEWQQLQQEIEQLAQQQDVLKRRQQVLLQLGPQPLQFTAGLSEPPTPSSLSEPLMPASETADHPLVQQQLLAQTSDASTLMDQHLQLQQLQQPSKRQKLLQPPQHDVQQGAAADGCQQGVIVLTAVFDTVDGPAAEETTVIELPGLGAVVIDERALSLDRLPSLETLLGGDW